MKTQRFISFFLIVITALSVFPIFSSAQGESVQFCTEVIDGILSFHLERSGRADLQSWLDREAAPKAGSGYEWYIIALSQYQSKHDFGVYREALERYLQEHEVVSASSRQKYALTELAVSSSDPFVEETAGNSIGKLGVMSLVFGLHLLNNLKNADAKVKEETLNDLLSFQHEDGGWSVSGQYGDVDVTAMTLQALAPNESCRGVKESVERALSLLSSRQTEYGDFASYGTRNAESCAQVITALSALGIDAAGDPRFIKDGRTLFDGLSLYRLPNGSFAHREGGDFNAMATEQVFCSMVAYLRYIEGKSPLFLLDAVYEDEREDPPVSFSQSEDRSEPSGASEREDPSKSVSPSENGQRKNRSPIYAFFHGYKFYACLAILLAAAIAVIVTALLRKKSYKSYLLIAICAIAALAFVLFTNFVPKDSYYSGESPVKDRPAGTVTLTVGFPAIQSDEIPPYLPQNGYFLEKEEFVIEEGDTVYSVLIEASRKHGLLLDGDGTYIRAINNLAEFDYGNLSGWMYFVNGTEPSVGCGTYKLKNGDEIEWLYTKDLGKDLR